MYILDNKILIDTYIVIIGLQIHPGSLYPCICFSLFLIAIYFLRLILTSISSRVFSSKASSLRCSLFHLLFCCIQDILSSFRGSYLNRSGKKCAGKTLILGFLIICCSICKFIGVCTSIDLLCSQAIKPAMGSLCVSIFLAQLFRNPSTATNLFYSYFGHADKCNCYQKHSNLNHANLCINLGRNRTGKYF